MYSGAPKIALFVGRVSSSSHRSLPTSTLGLPLTAFFVSFVASCPTMVVAIVVCINSIEVCGGIALLPFLSKEQPSSNEAIDNRLGEDWLRRERMELADILLVDGACRLWTTLPTACSGNASILYLASLHRNSVIDRGPDCCSIAAPWHPTTSPPFSHSSRRHLNHADFCPQEPQEARTRLRRSRTYRKAPQAPRWSR